MDNVRSEWLRVQFRFVTAVLDSVGTGIPFHYTTDVKIILLHFRRVHTIGLFLEPSRPLSHTERTSTGLFISPSGISELDCTTTKTDTAERNISIGREFLQFFFY